MCVLACFVVAAGPVLFAVPLTGRPVRFGVAVPASVLASGLSLRGAGQLQWRPLPGTRGDGASVWIELALAGPPGTVQVVLGGDGPRPERRGACYVYERRDDVLPHGRLRREQWTWCDGSRDERTRIVGVAPFVHEGEACAAGEAVTQGLPALTARSDVACRLPRAVHTAGGLLPAAGGGGATARAVRSHLQQVLPHLRELPGVRGAGDYRRSGGVVTNGEFDTGLALLRLGLGLGDPAAFAAAVRAAWHLVDRDVDPRTGLPFPHGDDHRCGVPEPGHVWLQGVLQLALVTADDELLAAATRIAAALAAQPPRGSGAQERLRDYAWPLRELELVLQVVDLPAAARAADQLAASIARRFDPLARTFRFGEGEVGNGVYFERGWLTAAVLLPALRLHLARRPGGRLAEHVAMAERALLDRVGSQGQGVPTHWRLVDDRVFAVHREQGAADVVALLDGLPVADLARLLRRSTVRAAVAEVPRAEDPDLPTGLTLVARCDWVWR